MKVVAFNGSPRKEGNTYQLIKAVFAELEKEGITTDCIHVGGRALRGCIACGKCAEMKNMQCALPDDGMNGFIDAMVSADAIILGSPVYFSNVSTEMKALIDRAGYVNRANGNPLRRKVGASVVAVRRAGAVFVFDALNHFFGIGEMVIVSSSYWNVAYGRLPGEVLNDEEGMRTMRDLGINIAWLLKKLKA